MISHHLDLIPQKLGRAACKPTWGSGDPYVQNTNFGSRQTKLQLMLIYWRGFTAVSNGSHHLRSLGVPPVSLHEGAGTPMFKTQILVVDKQSYS